MTKTHRLELTLDDLLLMDGMEGMNEALDVSMESAGLSEIATDISYTVVSVTDGVLTVEATYTPDEY